MTKLRVTKQDVVTLMADSLIEAASRENISLAGITPQNFNSFLDDAFQDGGETRCERFCDLAWPYSLQFGPLESDEFGGRQWACIAAAIKQVLRHVAKEEAYQ